MEDQSFRERLKKIQELVQRGEAGEQQNASALMDRLLKEHGLILEDLTDIKQLNPVMFPYADYFERRILLQLYGKVMNTDKVQFTNNDNQLLFLLTRFQEIQMKDLFRIYCKAWKEEAEIFFSAFVQKNEIFPNTPPEADSKEDFETLSRLVNLMRSVKKADVLPQTNKITEKRR